MIFLMSIVTMFLFVGLFLVHAKNIYKLMSGIAFFICTVTAAFYDFGLVGSLIAALGILITPLVANHLSFFLQKIMVSRIGRYGNSGIKLKYDFLAGYKSLLT